MNIIKDQKKFSDSDKENEVRFQNGLKLNKAKLLDQIKIISEKR